MWLLAALLKLRSFSRVVNRLDIWLSWVAIINLRYVQLRFWVECNATMFKLGVVNNTLLVIHHGDWHIVSLRFTSLCPGGLHSTWLIFSLKISVELLFELGKRGPLRPSCRRKWYGLFAGDAGLRRVHMFQNYMGWLGLQTRILHLSRLWIQHFCFLELNLRKWLLNIHVSLLQSGPSINLSC